MHLVTVYAHPVPGAFTASILEPFEQAFKEAGHTVDRIDLHAERFDPRFTVEDHEHYYGGPVPPGIGEMHRRVEKADRLAFVFPIYWWGLPAMMRGWIERVFTGGWAFGEEAMDYATQDQPDPLLPSIPTMLLATGATAQPTYSKYGYDEAMYTQLDVGTFAYCGLTDVESHFIYDVEGDAITREQGLCEVPAFARQFMSNEREVRNVKDDHLAHRFGIASR